MVSKTRFGTTGSVVVARMKAASLAQLVTGSLRSFGAEFLMKRFTIIIGPSFAISGCLNRH